MKGKNALGQLSLEALLSFAALLAATSILALSAQRMGGKFDESARLSAEEYSLSYSALCIDTAAQSLPGSEIAQDFGTVIPSGGWQVSSRAHPAVRQPLFHRASSGQGGVLYVQNENGEPV